MVRRTSTILPYYLAYNSNCQLGNYLILPHTQLDARTYSDGCFALKPSYI